MTNSLFKIKLFIVGLCFSALMACSQKIVSKSDDSNVLTTSNHKVVDELYPKDKIIISTHSDFTKKYYPERILAFKKSPLLKNDIVLLGDSITEQGGDWNMRLNHSKVKNRGISGDTTEGVLARLDEVIYCEPKQVFILIGINDLFRDDMTSELVFNNILKIVNQIHKQSPKTKIFVQTILPTHTEKIKEKIQMTNTLLINSEKIEPYEIISLHDDFANEQDLIDMKFSDDGVHLNEIGYKVWEGKIINLIKI